MKLKHHYRTSISTIEYIITDFNLNRIVNKDIYFNYCVQKRIEKIHKQYEEKLDSLLSLLVLYCDLENLPLELLSRLISSISKINKALMNGCVSLIT